MDRLVRPLRALATAVALVVTAAPMVAEASPKKLDLVMWGDSVLRGDTVFANEPPWATAIVWGDAAFADANLLDDNIVWTVNAELMGGPR